MEEHSADSMRMIAIGQCLRDGLPRDTSVISVVRALQCVVMLCLIGCQAQSEPGPDAAQTDTPLALLVRSLQESGLAGTTPESVVDRFASVVKLKAAEKDQEVWLFRDLKSEGAVRWAEVEFQSSGVKDDWELLRVRLGLAGRVNSDATTSYASYFDAFREIVGAPAVQSGEEGNGLVGWTLPRGPGMIFLRSGKFEDPVRQGNSCALLVEFAIPQGEGEE